MNSFFFFFFHYQNLLLGNLTMFIPASVAKNSNFQNEMKVEVEYE